MNLKLDNAVLSQSLTTLLATVENGEKPFSDEARAQLAELSNSLLPELNAELPGLIAGLPQAKIALDELKGIVAGRAMQLGLDAYYAQPNILGKAFTDFLSNIATAVKDPTVQMILKAALTTAVGAAL